MRVYVTRVCPWCGVLRDNEKTRFHVSPAISLWSPPSSTNPEHSTTSPVTDPVRSRDLPLTMMQLCGSKCVGLCVTWSLQSVTYISMGSSSKVTVNCFECHCCTGGRLPVVRRSSTHYLGAILHWWGSSREYERRFVRRLKSEECYIYLKGKQYFTRANCCAWHLTESNGCKGKG